MVETLREGGLFERAQIHYVATHVQSSTVHKLVQFARAVIGTVRALLSGNVALAHAHVSKGASFWRKALLLAIVRMFGVPTVFHLHSGAFDEFATTGGNFRRWCVRHTLERSDVVVVLSRRWSDWLRTFAPASNIRVIANPVNVPVTISAPSYGGKELSTGRVLFLGKICDEKGAYDLLRAWVLFSQHVKGWRLVIGGYGEVDRFLAVAQGMGVRCDIDFLGWVSGQDKIRELSAADIFVLPSFAEGMPVSILEAMAYGAAIIATPVGGVPDMIESEAQGILVRPGDVGGLANALSLLAGSPKLRSTMAASAREHVSKHYATPKVVEMIAAAYREVMASPRRSGA